MSEYTSQDQSIDIDLEKEDTSHLIQSPTILAVIKKVERRKTKTEKEPILISMEVVSDGIDKGKLVFDNIYDKLPNSPAGERMNKNRLKALAKALGLTKLTSTADLMVPNKVIMVDVSISQSQDFGARNEIKTYHAVNGTPMPTTMAPTAPIAPTAPLAPQAPIPNVAPPIGGVDPDAI